jgi:hypothetical protein
MDVEKRAEEFRESVKRLGARGRTMPYPAELRDEAVDYARERRGQGATWSLVAQEWGLGRVTCSPEGVVHGRGMRQSQPLHESRARSAPNPDSEQVLHFIYAGPWPVAPALPLNTASISSIRRA